MPDTSHLPWGAEQLWQALEPLLPGLSVEVVARCESTNTQLLERARRSGGRRDTPITGPGELDGVTEQAPSTGQAPMPFGRRADDTQPCLLVAEHQSRGRGRMGRLWQSSSGASLTFSLGVALEPRDWSGMSLAVGVAIADALDPLPAGGRPRIGLKWPNDLWLLDGPGQGRKLGGVLIETVAVGRRRMVVIGVGLNVTPQPTRELSSGYACLQELIPGVTAPEVLHRLARPLVSALQQFEAQGFAGFAPRYGTRDLLAGQPVVTTAAELPAGVAEGVSADGALRVRTAAGVQLLSSGEVSVRLQHGDPPPEATPA
ncbi:biotin--[acetyl-CoA-carboxylase] ligase [Ideonella sp. BN130291]|uniref:biotin--[acetyl-CoA-carboxylase] ligase n=1 Tax=Ideonella sp. BN130291 TaxID=3112940 RepID=UPI002E2554B4|nr:biotin--[acetyl-CoA-carboxylase] ligase [Ideonella sp. BN130291]